jgi:hypothetical protein
MHSKDMAPPGALLCGVLQHEGWFNISAILDAGLGRRVLWAAGSHLGCCSCCCEGGQDGPLVGLVDAISCAADVCQGLPFLQHAEKAPSVGNDAQR